MSIQRHTVYNLLGQGLPIVLALVTIPIYLRLVGEARYGALAIVWLLIGYFGLFDLGLGQAVCQRMSRIAGDQVAERATVFWTSLLANLALGAIGALVAWPLAHYFFGQRLSIEANLRQEIMAALPWVVLTVPVATLGGVLSGALQARERFLDLNAVSLAGNAAVQLLPLAVAAYAGPSLTTVIPAVLVARALTLAALFQRCSRHVFAGHSVSWNKAVAAELLRYGGWVTVSSVVGPMMVILDRFVIGALLGAKAISHYTVPFQLAERTTLLSSALNFALFPRLATAARATDRVGLGLQALRALAVVLSPLVAAGLLFIGPFLTWWISPEMATHSERVAQVLFLGFWINSLAMVPYTQLQAGGRPDLVAKCHAAELLPYLALLYAGLQGWGLVGAAAVFSIRAAADFVLLAHFAGTLAAALRLLAAPGLLLGLAFGICTPGGFRSPWHWVLGLSTCLVVTAWSLASAPASLRRRRPRSAY